MDVSWPASMWIRILLVRDVQDVPVHASLLVTFAVAGRRRSGLDSLPERFTEGSL